MRGQRPSGFIEPCLPSKAARPPSGSDWVHEIKFDGYRLMVRRDGDRVRPSPRTVMTGPTVSPPSSRRRSAPRRTSFLIDGEAAVANATTARTDFNARAVAVVTWCCSPSTCCSMTVPTCATCR